MKKKIISFILASCILTPGLIANAENKPEKILVHEEIITEDPVVEDTASEISVTEDTVVEVPEVENELEEVVLEGQPEEEAQPEEITIEDTAKEVISAEDISEEITEDTKVDITPAAEVIAEDLMAEEIPAEELALEEEDSAINVSTIYTANDQGIITKTVKSIAADGSVTEDSIEYGYIDEAGDFYIYVDKIKEEKTVTVSISYTKEGSDPISLKMILPVPENGVIAGFSSDCVEINTILDHINLPEYLTTGIDIRAELDSNGNIISLECNELPPEITETKVKEGELSTMDFELNKEYGSDSSPESQATDTKEQAEAEGESTGLEVIADTITESYIEEPVKKEEITEDNAREKECPVEESVDEESVIEESVAEESVAEEPVEEESMAEESVVDESSENETR